ncbi:hypothetical protein M8C21_015859 [Ambrosia artemisiifolia]|uniref:Uncharacterized protein n=1 Tax=Ambrosia artemisiifolia TaxID=4212 RepID=A0AAD5D265_AMBAR|nr:hypothetical protein M8C21_015859 [Ambrosia artemisiifolia]
MQLNLVLTLFVCFYQLQQYRQKKDGKGSKSSGKANKPDLDVVTDESSSVAKQTKGKKQLPETLENQVPVQDSATELVDSSNADVTTSDLSSTSDLPTEVSETDVSVSTSVPDENLQSSNLDDAVPAASLKTVNIEENPESDYVSVTPVGLEAVLDNFAGKAGEVKAASGEDQVPDVGAMQEHDHTCSSEPDNTVSLIHLEKEDRDQVSSRELEEDTKIEYANSAPEQTNDHDDMAGVKNMDWSSSTGLQSSGPGSTIQPKEDGTGGFHDDGGVKLSHRSGDSESSPVSLTQLAKALQLLSEDELRFVMAGREAVNGGDLKNDGDMKCDSVEFPERLTEQLYIQNFEKELTYLQLCEECDVRKKIDHENSSISASLCDVEGKNKILSEELAACRSELDRVTSEMEKLQLELKRSEHELSNVSSELVDSKNLLSEVQAKHENLSGNVFSLTEEKHKLEKEKGDLSLESEKFKKDLMECKSLLEVSQVENANTKESLALVMAERAKLEEEKESYVSEYEHFVKENKNFSMELLESQDLVESLRSEIAKLNENLELAAKEETRLGEEVNQLNVEKEAALTELTNCKSLLELSQAENTNLNEQFVHNSEQFSMELSESQHLVESLHSEIAKLSENLDLVTKEKTRLVEEVNRLTVEMEEKEHSVKENKKFSMELLDSQDLVESLRSEIAKLNENLELVTKEETRLGEEVNKLTVEKEAAETELTNCKSLLELSQAENANFNEQFVHSSKNFSLELSESQQFVESLRAEIAKLSEDLDLVTIEKTRLGEEVNCLTVEKEEKEHLLNENKKFSMELLESQDLVESLRSEIAKLNENLELVAKEETTLKEEVNQLTVEKEAALTELTNCKSLLELSQAENANFNEQLVHSSKNFSLELSESQQLVESLRAEIAKLSENFDLVTKEKTRLEEEVIRLTAEREVALAELANCKSLMNDLQVEHEKSMADLKDGAHLLEKLSKENVNLTSTFPPDSKLEEPSNRLEETFLRNVILDEYLKQYVFTVEAKKGELVILCEDLRQEVIATRTKSSELKEKLSNSESRIQELQEQVDELQQQADHMTEKNKDLEGRNELASYVIHKIFDNLQKIVQDSGPPTEQSEDDTASEQLDHLEISNYDVLIEKLIMILHERAQLESKNREYNVESSRRMKDMEELNKRCINPDVILKLIENIQCLVTLDNIDFQPDEPLSYLESVIHYLLKNLKFNEAKLIDLQNEIDNLTSSIVSYEIQSHVLKESLIAAMEQVVIHQSETQLKETELSQSEQRVSALREKLHIAVTKGKGLIQQRESLKQNLAATSNELEKCLHELQLKDATLQETETKLRTYSEAGERMEALESELSYIRNSATALRESFLLKDSVLQRIEEILEDLDLPEDFHVRDIIDKIDWLAKSVSQSQNSFPVSNQLGTIERTRSNPESGSRAMDGLYPESGSRGMDGWREDLEPSSGLDDELRRNYEELQNKFYGLAEQNEMLEQSLMERNNLVQRWEEVLDKINMPSQFRSLEPEDRIDWLRVALLESNDRCALLQQDNRELEKIHGSLAADLEESQRRLVDLESTLKAITDEREQLSASLEAQSHDYNKISEKASLYEIENQKLQNEVLTLHLKLDEKSVDGEHINHIHGEIRRLQDLVKEMLQVSEMEDLDSNTSDIQCLEGLLRKLADKQITGYEERSVDQSNVHGELERKLEAVEGYLVQVQDERERLVEKTQTLISEVEALEVKNQELKNLLVQEEQKTATLKEKLNMHEELERKLEAVEGNLVQVKDERERLVEKSQTLINEVEALEVKNHELKNLLVEEEQKTASVTEKLNMHEELERKLEAVQSELVQVKDERERLVEKSQTLIDEVKELESKNQELKNLLFQEEQKTASVKEKLNVAVRKGKSLVQVRDSMKQTINDLTSQVDRLNDEIKVRENTILEFQQKMNDIVASQELVENKDSEIRSLKDRLEESENELHDKRNTMSMILGALAEIDLGVDTRTSDPFEKMKQIEKVIQDLQAAMLSAEQDSRKSKRAAELLLAELNEVQERNEDLLEEISELSRQRDSAEASNRESLTRLEQLSALHSEERNSQFSELTNLKSCIEQLSPGLSKIYNLLDNVLPKDLEYLYNLEAGVKLSLESNDASNAGGQTLTSSHGGISSRSESKVNALFKSFFDNKTEELHNDNTIIDLWKFIGFHMQELITKIDSFEEKLQSHSKSLHEQAVLLCQTVPTLYEEITSHKHSLDSAKEEIAWLESTGKQKETENVMLRKYISTLYEACNNSVLEIQKSKGEMVADDSLVEDILSGETISVSEEGVTNIVNRLLSAVKDYHSNQTENVEVKLKEMKATISNLQKELTEKDVQKDRISVELVSQIKRAEAAATSHLQELESAKAHINDLKDQCNLLEQRIKELEGQESVLVELHEKVKSLTESSTAKEQENEALLQALDEEEAQMEDLRNKISELERLVKQKNLDLESAEAARGKALKKLSITVSKFDELHHLSETLVSEVDKLQSQLQERDSEISFLRDEITRITSDSLQALKTDERGLIDIQDILTWLDLMAPGVVTRDVNLDDNKNEQGQEQKEILKKQIMSIILELKDLRQVTQSKEDQLHIERSKVDELIRSLREKESRLSLHENEVSSPQPTSGTSEIVEVEPLLNKWPSQGTSMAPQVRSLRKVNNDQLAISIDDVDSDDRDKLDDDDDDKAHGFKSLTTSKFVPRFTRPVTDFVDGLWVSCDRTLMRQPALRLSLILYWALMHALLAYTCNVSSLRTEPPRSDLHGQAAASLFLRIDVLLREFVIVLESSSQWSHVNIRRVEDAALQTLFEHA